MADLFYNSSGYVYKTKQFFVYYNSPPDYLYASPSNDSIVYSRTGNNTALANSFLNLYKNMYWFSISESTGFATAMMSANNLLAYFGAPLSTAEQWHFEQDPSNNLHNLGMFRNEFDANGLPVNSVFPKNFANKYGGKAEIWYTYTKVKK